MPKIVLLEDESNLREEVAAYLRKSGEFEVIEVATIRQFYQFFGAAPCDIVVLDAMLPDGDGFTVAEDVRRSHPHCGVVMFTARDSTRDRIHGYSLGVDHYVSKPVRMDEFLAILQALSRRVGRPRCWRLLQADWRLEAPDGVHIDLSALEYKFLMALNTKPGSGMSRRHIIDHLGKNSSSYDDRNLDALVLRLRRKVRGLTAEPLPLKTLHGSGYALGTPLIDD